MKKWSELSAENKKIRVAQKDYSNCNMREQKFQDIAETIEIELQRENSVVYKIKVINLQKANLSGAILTGLNLFRGQLQEANLTKAYLGGVNLIGANLNGADLTGAFFDGNTKVTLKELEGARIDILHTYYLLCYCANSNNQGFLAGGPTHERLVRECYNKKITASTAQENLRYIKNFIEKTAKDEKESRKASNSEFFQCLKFMVEAFNKGKREPISITSPAFLTHLKTILPGLRQADVAKLYPEDEAILLSH